MLVGAAELATLLYGLVLKRGTWFSSPVLSLIALSGDNRPFPKCVLVPIDASPSLGWTFNVAECCGLSGRKATLAD